jgi:hypothetical protein
VGNLAYEVRWSHLKDFARAGMCVRVWMG